MDGTQDLNANPAVLYPRILAAVAGEPWAILPSKLDAIVDLLSLRASGGRLSADEIAARIGTPRAAQPMRVTPAQGGGTVAVLPFYGVVAQRMGMLAQSSGGLSTEAFGQTFQQAVDDPSVSAVVVEFDSPGGSTFGVEELAQQVYAARGVGKPIVAQVNSLCASAAYWVASQCDELVSTPGGMTGSIGVYTVHEDLSAAAEAQGLKVTYISAGKYKTERQPFQPLTDEALAGIQEDVDAAYALFTAAVARGRGVSVDEVRNGYGQGRMVNAKQAKALGLVDRVGTLDETVSRLAKGSSWARIASRPAALADEVTEPMKAEGQVPPSDGAQDDATAGLPATVTPKNDPPRIASHDEPSGAGEVERSLAEDDQTEEAHVASVAADPISTAGGKQVDEKEFRDTLAKYESQIADKDKQLEALTVASSQQAEHIAALQAADRRRRFTDMVMGRNGEKDGLRWYGEVAQNVAMLERVATAFGEDSDDFRAYVAMQEANAKQLSEVTRVIGTDAGDGEAAGGAWARIQAEADKLVAADSKLTHAAAVAAVMDRQPALYADYLAEARGGK